MMTCEANKSLVRRALIAIWNTGSKTAIDEFLAPNFMDHQPQPAPPPTLAAIKQELVAYRTAFPDLALTIEEQVAEGDLVVSRWTARATHRGPLWGIPATGQAVTVPGIFIDRVTDGRIVEEWASWDRLGLLQQLGVIQASTTSF